MNSYPGDSASCSQVRMQLPTAIQVGAFLVGFLNSAGFFKHAAGFAILFEEFMLYSEGLKISA